MAALLKAGLHPDASDALRKAGIEPERIGQTIGNAKASAGTHAQDGTANGHPYCAAVDLSVKRPGAALTHEEIHALLIKLASVGFAAFYREPGRDHWPATEVAHIHAVYAGCSMKVALRRQVHDWCNGLNGLKSHAPYVFFRPTQEQAAVVRHLFLAHNPASG